MKKIRQPGEVPSGGKVRAKSLSIIGEKKVKKGDLNQ